MIDDIKLNIPKGKYVIAVSGGVDSMALLHLLAKQPGVSLIVAHFDHGIRKDSHLDRQLVQTVAKQYQLPFVYDKIELGFNASEALARKARYKFLHTVREASNASAIITAHHQDDLIETAVINLIRGTGRKGLSSLKSTDIVLRPLLKVSKKIIINYATLNKLKWNEDISNQDIRYTRNYIRHRVLPRINEANRDKLVGMINNIGLTNKELDNYLTDYLNQNSETEKLNRYAFIILPHKIAIEILATWLRQKGIKNFNTKLLNKLTIAAKTLKSGQQVDINKSYVMKVDNENLTISKRNR